MAGLAWTCLESVPLWWGTCGWFLESHGYPIAPAILGGEVLVPPEVEAVADGAARQAAWALSGSAEPPTWALPGVASYAADPVPAVRERYAEARRSFLERVDAG